MMVKVTADKSLYDLMPISRCIKMVTTEGIELNLSVGEATELTAELHKAIQVILEFKKHKPSAPHRKEKSVESSIKRKFTRKQATEYITNKLKEKK